MCCCRGTFRASWLRSAMRQARGSSTRSPARAWPMGARRPGDGRSRLQQLYERNFIHLATALFSRELLALGCRFDETFEIMQDWDFFLQCAQHTAFHFEPRQTFEWRADSGSSGAAGGANHDPARFAAFRDRIYAKWASRRDALIDRVHAALERVVARARNGELDAAEAGCREILTLQPERSLGPERACDGAAFRRTP